MFVVYKHINPNNNECFYIGSGNEQRPKQLGIYQRGALYKLYCENNKLITEIGLFKGVNVIIEIITECSTKAEAMQIESKLIKENYGKQGYKLVNSQVGFNNFVTAESLQNRANKVSEARRKAVINITDKKEFESITKMANYYKMERTALQKRIDKIKDNPNHRFKDGINPVYK